MRGVSTTYYQQKAELPGIKENKPEYTEIHSPGRAGCRAARRPRVSGVLSAHSGRADAGLPALPWRECYRSFTYPQYGNGAVLDGGVLSLSKIGRIHIRLHRPLGETPKTVTISREADGWYVAISCADVPVQRLPPTDQETGIDLGIEAFATLSNGRRIFSPGWYRKAERALKTAQRQFSRRKKGSHRRRKAVALLAKAHQTVRRQRQDVHHKTALALVREKTTIYHEDLQVRNMLKNHHLAKSIADAGWSQFLSILSFKAVCAGRSVVAVHPALTSQRCSGCAVLVAKGLSVRWHACPQCGTSLHRDHNAAKNIKRLGRSLRGAVALAAAENREAPGF
jgi:putative transposase